MGRRSGAIGDAAVLHFGDMGIARKLIDAASPAGADEVKFQSFSADDLSTAP